MTKRSILQTRSLREQVYDYLREAINRGELNPGVYLDLNEIGDDLGISRTPLRDAFIQLEIEGFVTILPRRGVVVNELDLDSIRHIYELIGALEGAVVVSVGDRMGEAELDSMQFLNAEMVAAVEAGDFGTYYDRNLAFHRVFLKLSDNASLVRTVEVLKHRLYDFPRRKDFVTEWESASIGEHAAIVALLSQGDARGAADYLRDVHWSFEVQRPFIRQYYFPELVEDEDSSDGQ